MYGLTAEDRRIRDTAAAFVESLMPYEVEAELAGGRLPKELTAEFHARPSNWGCTPPTCPTSVGGPGCTALQQVLVQEQVGRVTNGLAWARPPPAVVGRRRHRLSAGTLAAARRCAARSTRRTPSPRSSPARCVRPRCHRAPGRRRYVVNGTKWHVTSYNLADYLFVQAVLENGEFAGDHVLLVVDLPWPGVEVVRTPHYSHHIADEHPIVSFTDVRVPVSHLVGAEGEGMTFTQDWFRFERLMVASRCVGAAQRLVDEMTEFARHASSTASRSANTSWSPGCWPTARPNCSRRARCSTRWPGPSMPVRDRKPLHGQASMAKLYCSEMAGRVADRAVQVFGGRGYMRENVAERMFRELRVERIWEGASEIQRVIVARQLMNRGSQALLDPS